MTQEITAPPTTLVSFAQRYAVIKAEMAELKEKVKLLDGERDQINVAMTGIMESMEMQRFSIEGLGTFYLQSVFYPKVVGDPEKVIAWLDGEGAEAVAPRTISKTRLKELIEERLEKDQPVPPTELVECSTTVEVRLRSQK